MIKIFNAVTIPASGSSTSVTFPMAKGGRGVLTVGAVITGSGTCKMEYLVPANFTTEFTSFVEPTTSEGVSVTDFAPSPVPAGSYALSFKPVPTDAIQIRITETSGANSITISAIIMES